jgi:hypothetical protein
MLLHGDYLHMFEVTITKVYCISTEVSVSYSEGPHSKAQKDSIPRYKN